MNKGRIINALDDVGTGDMSHWYKFLAESMLDCADNVVVYPDRWSEDGKKCRLWREGNSMSFATATRELGWTIANLLFERSRFYDSEWERGEVISNTQSTYNRRSAEVLFEVTEEDARKALSLLLRYMGD